jgi:DUF1680 family protein
MTTLYVLTHFFLIAAETKVEPGRLAFEPIYAEYRFGGVFGPRIQANVDHWLLTAPEANPGMLEMFRVRDRSPTPQLVPWAGEFVGKYLISAIGALRMTDDPRLEARVRSVVAQLVASQADDGYLGPFPKKDRLLGNWDLWGHYHCILALLLWHERSGDAGALAACRRAADLMCKTYLGTNRRVFDAGSHEMNMAVVHGLGMLFRVTREKRYLELMREIERDWERAGDYFRTGLAGVEFFRTPRPRWESLHDLQGLVELYSITGDERYRQAFLHHWHSIRRWDRRNTGGFSSAEQATGNPYANTAIETCCTIAWMAITVDALQLTGQSVFADELELATFNAVAGAQHPSGRWWTYSTPMDGVREASAHSIVFQARAGTPELNCCSVNAPRGLCMLSEWTVMRSNDGIVINHLGPMTAKFELADQTSVELIQEGEYPLHGEVRLTVRLSKAASFALAIRIPNWCVGATVDVAGEKTAAPPGSYYTLRREWRDGDNVRLSLPLQLRVEAGDKEAFGRVSVYRGPILLAYDQRFNAFDEEAIPPLRVAWLSKATVVGPDRKPAGVPAPVQNRQSIESSASWLLVDVPTSSGKALRLCDFASAGATGTRYRSWLSAEDAPPPPPAAARPADASAVPAGPILFSWRRPAAGDRKSRLHTVEIFDSLDQTRPIVVSGGHIGEHAVLPAEQSRRLARNRWYHWRLVAKNAHGQTSSLDPPRRFKIDPSLPPASPERTTDLAAGPDGILAADSLRGRPTPSFGELRSATGVQSASGPNGADGTAVELDGKSGMLRYQLGRFPVDDYSMSIWLWVRRGQTRLGQVFSGWHSVMDDPLRVCVEGGRLFARIEAGAGYSTPGVVIEPESWHHVAAVKAGEKLTLYLDGKSRGSVTVPVELDSAATDFAIGGNPHYSGDEFLGCRVADLRLYARALAPDEVARLAQRNPTQR